MAVPDADAAEYAVRLLDENAQGGQAVFALPQERVQPPSFDDFDAAPAGGAATLGEPGT